MLLKVFAIALCSVYFTVAQDKKDDLFEIESKNPLSHGYGDDIEWVPWDDAIDLAQEQKKPIFLLIHKSWCHACQTLKKRFQQQSAFKELKAISKHFIMVNTEDDEEPWEEKYQPDGKYIPRLLFLDSDGDVLDFKNPKAEYEKYTHYYASPSQIFNGMRAVLKDKYNIEVPDEGKERQEKKIADSKNEDKKETKKDEKKDTKKEAADSKNEDKKETKKDEKKDTKKETKKDL